MGSTVILLSPMVWMLATSCLILLMNEYCVSYDSRLLLHSDLVSAQVMCHHSYVSSSRGINYFTPRVTIHPSIHRVVSSRASNGFDTVEETPPHLHRAIHRPLLRGTVVLHLLHIDIHSYNAISTSQLE